MTEIKIPKCQNDDRHKVKMRRYKMLSADEIVKILSPFAKVKADIPELTESPNAMKIEKAGE